LTGGRPLRLVFYNRDDGFADGKPLEATTDLVVAALATALSARTAPALSAGEAAALSDLPRFRSSAAPPVAPDRTLGMSPKRSQSGRWRGG